MYWKQVRGAPYYLFTISLVVFYHVVFHYRSDTNLTQGKLGQNISIARGTVPPSIHVQTAKGNVTWFEVNENIFVPMGYTLAALTSPIPTLVHLREPTCEQIFSEWLALANSYESDKVPLKDVDTRERDNYTLNGYALYTKNYWSERSPLASHVWSQIPEWLKADPLEFVNYKKVGMSIYHAMQHHKLTGLSGFTVGSIKPWVEVFALRAGAAQILTVEYRNTSIVENDQVTYAHPLTFAKNFESYGPFDFAASFSSIEHSGLQRYGDPGDPIGDLREILKIRCMLKPKALLFLGLPRSQDQLIYNELRIYGRIRLALIFTGFELVNVFRNDNPLPIELSIDDFDGRTSTQGLEQDTFVLRKL